MASKNQFERVKGIVDGYFQAVASFVNVELFNSLSRIVMVLQRARQTGATIYIAGNGGSAATASHWANDLGKATKSRRQLPVRVMSLNDNVSWMTALANDEGYERVFTGQLENFAKAGDVLIVISASGNSKNLVEAVELARQRSMTTVALLGFDGGILKGRVDECLWLPTERGAYGVVEGMHGMICHVLTACLAEERQASLDGADRAEAANAG